MHPTTPLCCFPSVAAAWKIYAYDHGPSECNPGTGAQYRVISGSGNQNCMKLAGNSFPAGVTCVAYKAHTGDGPLSCDSVAMGQGGYGGYFSTNGTGYQHKFKWYTLDSCPARGQLLPTTTTGQCISDTGEEDIVHVTIIDA